MSQSTSPSPLGTITLDVPPTIQPKYRGISSRRKQDTEAAIDTAFRAQDKEGLRWAIYQHLSSNSDLAEIVSKEIFRKLPWVPCDNPLTPYNGCKPLSWLVNWLASRRHSDIQRKEVWPRQNDVQLDSYRQEPLLYDLAGPQNPLELIPDDVSAAEFHQELDAFFSTLTDDESELLETCLSEGKERKGFRAIIHKAKGWSKPAVRRSRGACECYSCTKRSYSSLDALRSVDDIGTLAATNRLLRALPARRRRPADWDLEPIRTQVFEDKWHSRGRSRTTPASTNADHWQPIPAALYHQITEGC
jgi:hypothetical protein